MAGSVKVFRINASVHKSYDIVAPVISSNSEWKSLSPFHLGPCKAPGGLEFQNMENLWQFSKVYHHLGHVIAEGKREGLPSEGWYDWRTKGADDSFAHRHPGGKGSIPEYSYWNGRKLSYITSRKMIYVPQYCKLALKEDKFKELREAYKKGAKIAIKDFDAYDTDSGIVDIMNDPSKIMGHGFVLAFLIEDPLFYKRYIV